MATFIQQSHEKQVVKFYRFWDMHSGGAQKTPYDKIYIRAYSEAEAIDKFEREFQRHPFNVTCQCCGEDFSISEYDTLAEACAYFRTTHTYDKDYNIIGTITVSLLNYLRKDSVCVIK